MRRIALTRTLLALATACSAGPQPASTRFIDLVSTPATVSYSASGEARIVLEPPSGEILGIAGHRKVSVRIDVAKATSFKIFIGKISGTTVSTVVVDGAIDGSIHTVDVVGPEMMLVLTGGPPNTTDTVRIWVYLSS